tara:strand:- start:7531 stop:8352 length:822 start_codon:yes stop_codon:yes gene_type:complete
MRLLNDLEDAQYEIERILAMRTVECKKDQVIAKLKENRKKHEKSQADAVKGWTKKLTDRLENILADLTKGNIPKDVMAVVHKGHMSAVIEASIQMGSYRANGGHGKIKIVFVPTGDKAPHKCSSTPAHHRIEMLKLAIDFCTGIKGQMEIETLETDAPGPMFAYQTVGFLIGKHHPCQIAYLIGADQAAKFFINWKNPDQISSIAEPVMMTRPGFENVKDWPCSSVNVRAKDVSSTELRKLLADKKYRNPLITKYINSNVLKYIKKNKLYLDQ